VASVAGRLDTYDFAHAALELYDFFWSELCDWYLEIVKPRLYDADAAAAGNLLHVLERVLALAHPVLPFVTEAIWAEMPGHDDPLVVSPYPVVEESRFDAAAEAELGAEIELTRAIRRWRDLAGVDAGAVLLVRGAEPHELVGRLARVEFGADGSGEPIANVGAIEILTSDGVDAERAREGVAARRRELESEVARAEGKLANERFVAKAPEDVVEAERDKLDRYRRELEELG
jgi:valyl-tRNA synthetase